MKNVRLYQTTEEFLKDTEARRIFPHILYDKESGKLIGERSTNTTVAFTIEDNQKLIKIARVNNWIASDAIKMTKGECINVFALDGIDFTGIISLNELKYFVSLSEIPTDCLKDITTLSAIELPKNINKINENSFYGCTNLNEIIIPEFVEEIGSFAFRNCNTLNKIIVKSKIPAIIGDDVFADTNNCDILVPTESLTVYKTTWREYSSRIKTNNL